MRVWSNELSPIPTHVRVGPYRYRVVKRDPNIRADSFDFDNLIMRVNSDHARDAVAVELMELVIQACQTASNNEAFIAATWILSVLRDNPDLVAYLTDPRDVP